MRGRSRGAAVGVRRAHHAVQERLRGDVAARCTVLVHVHDQLRAVAGYGQEVTRRGCLRAHQCAASMRAPFARAPLRLSSEALGSRHTPSNHAAFAQQEPVVGVEGVQHSQDLDHET